MERLLAVAESGFCVARASSISIWEFNAISLSARRSASSFGPSSSTSRIRRSLVCPIVITRPDRRYSERLLPRWRTPGSFSSRLSSTSEEGSYFHGTNQLGTAERRTSHPDRFVFTPGFTAVGRVETPLSGMDVHLARHQGSLQTDFPRSSLGGLAALVHDAGFHVRVQPRGESLVRARPLSGVRTLRTSSLAVFCLRPDALEQQPG